MNVVFILSDRHSPAFSGCYGNAVTRTPHIDSLAEGGVRFESAYCLSPTCVPARASMMSGRYIHEIGTWCNSFPYTGIPHGWGHFFAEEGVLFTTVGKLDFQPGADCGIGEERLAKHRESLDVLTLYREEEIQTRTLFLRGFCKTGPADSLGAYARDIRVAEEAAGWIVDDRPDDRSWILEVNFSQLHRPWNPTQDLWDHYEPLVGLEDLDERYFEEVSRLHPFHRAFTRYSGGEFVTPEEVRRGVVGYHAACEILDRNVGVVLQALERAGIREETLVVYGSDHAGNCGEHRSLDHGGMYEESIRVPLIFCGPTVREGQVESLPVSNLDLFPTVCEAVGLEPPDHLLGISLLGMLRSETDATGPEFALCQYHATGFPGGGFALRCGPYKVVECVGERPMLFDLEQDPHEMHDLVVEQPEAVCTQETIRRLRGMLYRVCAPEAVDARAKADQRALRERLAASGQLFEELWRRGYERNAERLVARKESNPQADSKFRTSRNER